MKTLIKNEFLTVEILHKGAELASITKAEENYIWDIDAKFWDKTSPILFPIVGGLKDNSYEYEGEKYQLSRHGFARDYDFELVSKTESSALFSLNYSEDTLKIYPFKFTLDIEYYLIDSQVFIHYKITNRSSRKMYYSIGAHPAFSIDGKLEDYSLKFDQTENLLAHQLHDNLFSGELSEINLQEKILPLHYSLFEKDAIVLKDAATSSLTLLKNNKPRLKVNFTDFPFLGIWTKKDAPFICIEPWLGIADSHTSSGKIEEKEGIQILEGNTDQSFSWSVEIF